MPFRYRPGRIRNRAAFNARIRLISAALLLPIVCVSSSLQANDTMELGYFSRAIAKRPNDLKAHLNYQRIALKLHGRSHVQKEYQNRLKTNPDNGLYLYLYARLIADGTNARSYLERAVQAAPTLYQARVDLGKIYYSEGEYDDAIAQYRAALKQKTSAGTHNLLGLAYYHKGYAKQAVAEYRLAIQHNNQYVDAYLNLGLTCYYTGQIDAAIDTYRQVLKQAPSHADAPIVHRNLGMAYARKGQVDRAEKAYRKALALKPGFTEVHVNLGNLAFNNGRFEDAVQAYEKALGTPQENDSLHFRLGIAHYSQQAYQNSARHLQKALEQAPEHPQTYYYLGLAYNGSDRPQDAIKALETYVKKEQRLAHKATVFKAKQLLEDLKRSKYHDFFKNIGK